MLDFDYSVDKVKIEYQVVRNEDAQLMMNSFELSSNVESFYQSGKIASCRYNFLLGSSDARVYVGVTPNWNFSNSVTSDTSIIIEYNPNKISPWVFKELKFLASHSKFLIKFLSIDFAVDMRIDYNLLRIKKRDAREKFTVIGKRNAETRYLGDYGDNHVKFYNKAVEQNLNVDWSRFEITCKKINSVGVGFAEFCKLVKLPEIYMIGQCSFDELSMTPVDRLALTAIIDDISLLYTITTYRTRKKFENYLCKALTNIDIDIKKIYSSYVNFINEYIKL